MKVDTDKIREIFDRETPYRIHKQGDLDLEINKGKYSLF